MSENISNKYHHVINQTQGIEVNRVNQNFRVSFAQDDFSAYSSGSMWLGHKRVGININVRRANRLNSFGVHKMINKVNEGY